MYLFYLQCALDVGFGLEMSSDAVALHRLMKLVAKIILEKRHNSIAADLCEAAWSDTQTMHLAASAHECDRCKMAMRYRSTHLARYAVKLRCLANQVNVQKACEP